MQLENLKELTDSIKKGERIVLLPPGIFSLITLVLSIIITTVLIASSLIKIFFSGNSFEIIAALQFSGLGLTFAFAILPNLMILSGKKKYSIFCFYYTLSLLATSSFILLTGFLNFIDLNNTTIPLLVSITLSLACIFIYHSTSYLLVREFFYYLKNPEANEY